MIRFLTSIDLALKRFFDRVELSTRVSTRQLALFRVFFGAILLSCFLPSWSWLNEVPPGFFDPQFLSFAYLTDDFLPGPLYVFLDVVVIILLLLITLGIYTRSCLLLLFLLSSMLYSYSFSFGKVDHYTNLFLFTYPVLGFTNSGTQFALRKDRALPARTQTISLIVMGIIIAFGYFNAGLAKCLSWIDFDLNTSGFLDWVYYCFFNSENQYLLAPYVLKVPGYLFEPLDYLAALFEVSGFFFLLKGRKYWLFYLTVASIFHLTNLLVLNLSFALNVLCYGIFLVSPVLSLLHRRYYAFYADKVKYFIYVSVFMAIFKIMVLLTDLPVYNYHNYAPLIHFEHVMDFLLWSFSIGCGVVLLKRELKPSNMDKV